MRVDRVRQVFGDRGHFNAEDGFGEEFPGIGAEICLYISYAYLRFALVSISAHLSTMVSNCSSSSSNIPSLSIFP